MDHAYPDGKKIGIAISRIPSEKPEARRGALLLIPGGPGGSALGAPSGKGQKLPQDVRDTYDLIGFDPRGVGRSTPVSCGLEQRGPRPLETAPLARPRRLRHGEHGQRPAPARTPARATAAS